MSNLIKDWMDGTTTLQWDRLTGLAGTSVTYLYQLASGRRKPSSDMAARLEKAAEVLNQEAGTKLLPRHLISETCGGCHYAGRKAKP